MDIPDPTGNNMAEKVFTGPIQRQLRDALAYIRNYTIKEVTIKDKNRAETVKVCNYPFAAIEEILSNAVYHRSYQISEPITVRIMPEGIGITSFPGFDRSISDESIATYNIRARVYRNRRIGDFLKELKLIEGRNTGFPNAIRALTENGSGLPQFEMDDNRGFLSVTIPVHSYFIATDKKSDKKRAYEEKILAALKEKPLLLTELAAAMGYKGLPRNCRSRLMKCLLPGR